MQPRALVRWRCTVVSRRCCQSGGCPLQTENTHVTSRSSRRAMIKHNVDGTATQHARAVHDTKQSDVCAASHVTAVRHNTLCIASERACPGTQAHANQLFILANALAAAAPRGWSGAVGMRHAHRIEIGVQTKHLVSNRRVHLCGNTTAHVAVSRTHTATTETKEMFVFGEMGVFETLNSPNLTLICLPCYEVS
jgi:hypothetical protein